MALFLGLTLFSSLSSRGSSSRHCVYFFTASPIPPQFRLGNETSVFCNHIFPRFFLFFIVVLLIFLRINRFESLYDNDNFFYLIFIFLFLSHKLNLHLSEFVVVGYFLYMRSTHGVASKTNFIGLMLIRVVNLLG